MRKLIMGCAVGVLVVLSARSEARPPAYGNVSLAVSLLPASQVGIASWYGAELQGSPTANGEPYDMNGLTAAHRDLPLGTRVRVTNLLNKRAVTLRINDRGPNVRGRLLDVSAAAAKRLGFLRAGLAPVRVRLLDSPVEQHRDIAKLHLAPTPGQH
ncbi:MAG: septal ring lytic transglycosylase RlpA family protein [Acidobacteriia bacterium]|nr:septal ring lytic transglycosylase RlpA family protein [Terriglobia bacterium]